LPKDTYLTQGGN